MLQACMVHFLIHDLENVNQAIQKKISVELLLNCHCVFFYGMLSRWGLHAPSYSTLNFSHCLFILKLFFHLGVGCILFFCVAFSIF